MRAPHTDANPNAAPPAAPARTRTGRRRRVRRNGPTPRQAARFPFQTRLLRSEHRSCAVRAEQWMGHVSEDPDAVRRRRPQFAVVDARKLRERVAAVVQRRAIRAEQPQAEGGERARPAVGRGRTSDRDDQLARAGVERGGDDLAESAGGRAQWIGCAHQGQPAGDRQFDDRDVVRQAAGSGRRPGGRPDRCSRARPPPRARDRFRQRVERALAAVRHRREQHLVVRARSMPPAGGEQRRRVVALTVPLNESGAITIRMPSKLLRCGADDLLAWLASA